MYHRSLLYIRVRAFVCVHVYGCVRVCVFAYSSVYIRTCEFKCASDTFDKHSSLAILENICFDRIAKDTSTTTYIASLAYLHAFQRSFDKKHDISKKPVEPTTLVGYLYY